jgi:hypothetical protein
VRFHVKQPGKRWLAKTAGLGIAGILAASVVALVVTDSLSPHGVLFGRLNRCAPVGHYSANYGDVLLACSTPGRHVIVAEARKKIQFGRAGDRRVYVAVTDSMGRYTASLPAGHYIIKGFFPFLSPAEATVTAGQRVEADFQYIWPD